MSHIGPKTQRNPQAVSSHLMCRICTCDCMGTHNRCEQHSWSPCSTCTSCSCGHCCRDSKIHTHPKIQHSPQAESRNQMSCTACSCWRTRSRIRCERHSWSACNTCISCSCGHCCRDSKTHKQPNNPRSQPAESSRRWYTACSCWRRGNHNRCERRSWCTCSTCTCSSCGSNSGGSRNHNHPNNPRSQPAESSRRWYTACSCWRRGNHNRCERRSWCTCSTCTCSSCGSNSGGSTTRKLPRHPRNSQAEHSHQWYTACSYWRRGSQSRRAQHSWCACSTCTSCWYFRTCGTTRKLPRHPRNSPAGSTQRWCTACSYCCRGSPRHCERRSW